MPGGRIALWMVILILIPTSMSQEFRNLGNLDENRNLTFADFRPGLYLLGDVPINSTVKSFCAFGIIQTNETDINATNEMNIRGGITFFIRRGGSPEPGIMSVFGPYNVVMQSNATRKACVRPSKLVVMQSDKIYVYIGRSCNENGGCPLQVSYRSDEEIAYDEGSNSINRMEARMRLNRNMLDLISINMTSLNVQVNFQDGSTSDSMAKDFVAVSVSVVAVVLVLILVPLLLLLVYAYRMKKKYDLATLSSSNGRVQEVQVMETGFSAEYRSLELFQHFSVANAYDPVPPLTTDSEPFNDARGGYYFLAKEDNCSFDQFEEHDYEEPYFEPASEEEGLLLQLKKLSIPVLEEETEIKILKLLGSGAFGKVYKGMWSHCKGDSDQAAVEKVEEVAIKTMEDETSEEDRVKFLQEAAIMGQFNHPNIIRLLGIIATTDKPLKIIIELMARGDLRKHISQIKPGDDEVVPPELAPTLLSYSRQIANGMMYLAVKSFVHRDLAARNILVSEDCICKIADFGLSRDLQDQNFYTSHGGKIPVKWTAPEALHYHKYSTASDVWSYGCVLYEIWSLGFKPFHFDTNAKVMKKVSAGFRLPPPPGCPRAIYDVMIQCWKPEADERPAFVDIMIPLQKPDFQILNWSEDDIKSSSAAARTLGSPLEAGLGLHKDLQRTYLTEAKTHSKKDSKTTVGETSDEEGVMEGTEGKKLLAASSDAYELVSIDDDGNPREKADSMDEEDGYCSPLQSEDNDNDSISDGYV